MDNWQDFRGGSITFDAKDPTRGLFNLVGLIVGIGDEVLEGVEGDDHEVPFYTLMHIFTGYNLFTVNIPNAIADLMLKTQKQSQLNKLVILDGVLQSRWYGSYLVDTNNVMIATALQFSGELDITTDVDTDEML